MFNVLQLRAGLEVGGRARVQHLPADPGLLRPAPTHRLLLPLQIQIPQAGQCAIYSCQ